MFTQQARPENASPIADPGDLTTDTRSGSFTDAKEKRDFLLKYLIAPADIIDAEYHIFYHDNSKGLVPGPSDFDVRVALLIKPEDIPLWTEHFEEIPPDTIKLSLWDGLATDNISWDGYEATYYKRENAFSYLVVFKDANIILKAMSTMAYL